MLPINVSGMLSGHLKMTCAHMGCRKLVGREGWRIRVGNYRVIYEIDEIRHILTILHVGHRRDIYR